MELMPDYQMCLTFAGDEAGDASFSFDGQKNPPS
jgi:hypothetical protein